MEEENINIIDDDDDDDDLVMYSSPDDNGDFLIGSRLNPPFPNWVALGSINATMPIIQKEEEEKKEVVLVKPPPQKKRKISTTTTTTTTTASDTPFSAPRTCPVCEEKRYGYEIVICPFVKQNTKEKCGHQCCKSCMKRWIENTPFHLEPNCMECNSIFSRSYIAQVIGKTWVNVDYAKIRQKVLFERAQARFPDVRARLEAKERLDKWRLETRVKMDRYINRLKTKIEHLRQDYMGAATLFEQVYQDYANNRRPDIPEYLQLLPTGIDLSDVIKMIPKNERKDDDENNELTTTTTSKLKSSQDEEDEPVHHWTLASHTGGTTTTIQEPIQIRNILFDVQGEICLQFPSGDIETCNAIRTQDVTLRQRKKAAPQIRMNCPKIGCKGTIASDWICNTCHCGICSECHIELDRGTIKIGTSASGNENIVEIPLSDLRKAHQCKPDDIEMAEYLRSKTKPCPNCKTLIEKSVGCSQVIFRLVFLFFDVFFFFLLLTLFIYYRCGVFNANVLLIGNLCKFFKLNIYIMSNMKSSY